jgi:hypothetical protein
MVQELEKFKLYNSVIEKQSTYYKITNIPPIKHLIA